MSVDTTLRRVVGQSVPRRDAGEKLRGRAQFAGDIVVPHMLHGKVLRSTYAGKSVFLGLLAPAADHGQLLVL